MNSVSPPELTPVEKTIYLTVVSRARDAHSRQPILGDSWSVCVRDGVDYDFDALRMPEKEKFTVAIRGKQLDDWCRDFIRRHPDAVVIELGCGLDDRSRRISPPDGVDWYDVDFDAVMNFRSRVSIPRSLTGTVHEVRGDATEGSWVNELPSGRPVFVIADGFIPFIQTDRLRALVRQLIGHFPSGEIGLNGYTTLAARLLKRITAMKTIGLMPDMGAAFDDPRTPELWDPRLRLAERSMLSRSPYVARMPVGQRIACRVLNWFPALAAKSDAGVLLYRF
ncbi:class I SAM-dependent methyltransferase [Paramicrobacterium fandaimingii]|uniref:class I SAM-dependent methyltransferase n=1 Tax=Paramicrobacterium fandaimingii TaxID=2708079 RepID=UPI0014200712|nr:class I SAM-dependent methyltransferase [Microbacterium fandaimingii]